MMARWLILHSDGAVAEQVMTNGAKPPAPEGGRVHRISRFGDLARERFDGKRWRHCPVLAGEAEARERARAEEWLSRLPPGVAALLAERAAEIVFARLNAAVPNDEGKKA